MGSRWRGGEDGKKVVDLMLTQVGKLCSFESGHSRNALSNQGGVMYTFISRSKLILPLTREVFAGRGQRPIIGRVRVCTRGTGPGAPYLGNYLGSDEGDRTFYSHPSLFVNDGTFDDGGGFVSVGLEGDMLVVRERNPNKKEVGTTQLRTAAPVETALVSIDVLLDFAARFAAQGSRCSSPGCENDSELKLRQCALVFSQGKDFVVCGPCCDAKYGKKDPLSFDDDEILVDGRLLPVGAPVTFFASR